MRHVTQIGTPHMQTTAFVPYKITSRQGDIVKVIYCTGSAIFVRQCLSWVEFGRGGPPQYSVGLAAVVGYPYLD